MRLKAKQEIRVEIISQYISGKINYRDAFNSPEISERHFIRLVKRFRKDRISSVLYQNTEKPPPNK